METWLITILISIPIAISLKLFLGYSFSPRKNLPPGPPSYPIIGNLLWLKNSLSDIEYLLRNDLRKIYGPIITLRVGSRPLIFIGSHSAAHRALIQNGAVFADRPTGLATSKITTSNRCNISAAGYGATWRLLRRNLVTEILHPSRVKSYSHARAWVFQILVDRLSGASSLTGDVKTADGVKVMDHFQYAMFCLLVLMCFGDKRDEKQIRLIETSHRNLLLNFARFNILNLFPRLGKIIFRNRWKELISLRKSQEEILIPIIRSRIDSVKKQKELELAHEERVVAYVDTLVDLELPDEKRKLNEGELVTICSEFLNAGTDTTSTALQWIMANLVKFSGVQSRLYEEIVGVVGPKPEHNHNKPTPMIEEEDLQKMTYLKAVVLEGLRRHPPGHFVLPHTVTEEVELDGHVFPKGVSINFMVADMGWDPKVWDQPMEFKPERFLSNDTENCIGGVKEGGSLFDISGSREIKMMPFGVGRRICPGLNLAMLHLEFFVANLVWYFEWKAVEGNEVDLSEKREFTTVMKNPLRVHLVPRG